MVMVKVSETYDLSTKVNRMGLVGIHTPKGNLISRLWPGMLLQHKKFRFVKCDVAMACASMLPADPLQVGVEAGSIAPQDLFNPILYKAVSNQSMNQFLAWLNVVEQADELTGAFNQNSVVDVNNPVFKDSIGGEIDQFKMYYALLSDTDGWRKAMPQAGLTMRDLVPLVFQVVSQYGVGPVNNADDAVDNVPAPALDADSVPDGPPASTVGKVSSVLNRTMRGPSMRMPAIDTSYFANDSGTDSVVVPGFDKNVGFSIDKVPPAYVGLIVLPPAKLNQLYYRLKVSWTIEFTGIRSTVDYMNWGGLMSLGNDAYGTDYDVQSKSMANTLGMADTAGADITKIMEGC
ncbi:capsid protein [Chicken smacovirus mg4_885]|uniref:Capsid protein n=1 Tax=Chicken smacovirus mg4_885 TaxID=2720959 RepID=A0A6G9W2Q4_9VIRU|nr:capsid protein [Chicken smacovirus mg4_885]QIR82264.1 capsid protein [Chicken smacovirus mg4_885]